MKNILLLGSAGKTGIPYSHLLLKAGHRVFAHDQNPSPEYPPEVIQEIISHERFFLVDQNSFRDESILDKVDSVTLSPGVPLNQPLIRSARKRGKKIFSEVDFCRPYLEHKKWLGITGTDGKSTVAALTDHLLNQLGEDSTACGNIGVPLSRIALEDQKISPKVLTVELSSYQLELAEQLTLDMGVLLNIAPDHLNRYDHYQDYVRTKLRIADKVKQGGGFITSKKLYDEHFQKNQGVWELNIVDTDELSSSHFFWENKAGGIYFLYAYYENGKEEKIISSEEIPLKGRHNLSNILFALETAHRTTSKQPTEIPSSLWASALKSFAPLPHRFEFVKGKYAQITYINDSKATTCHAVGKAVQNVPAGSYLFLGGRGKGEDYSALSAYISTKKLKLLLFGEEKDHLLKSLSQTGCEILGTFQKLKEAVDAAHEHYRRGNQSPTAFLLSPACTSWDAYPSFEARGNDFKNLIQ